MGIKQGVEGFGRRDIGGSGGLTPFEELCQHSDRLRQILERAKVPVKSDPSSVRREFEALDVGAQIEFVNRVAFFAEFCAEAVRDGYDLLEDRRLIWFSFARLGVRPPSDLFERVGDNDYVEIYDTDGIQVLRNFEFCRLITYSLQEILLLPWSDLYGREGSVTQSIFKAIELVFTEKRTIVDLGIPVHVCGELRSGSGRQYRVAMKYFAPLFDKASGQVRYFLAGSQIDRLS